MNELARTNGDILSQPNALKVHEDELYNTVNACIAKCFADLNQLPPNDPAYLVTEVTNSILNKYPAIRLQEIPEAFSNGIRGDYGQYFGLCVISFEQFISGYLTSHKRQEMVKQHQKSMDTKIEPTANQKYDTAKHLVIEALMIVKNGGVPTKTATTVYTFLDGIGLIDKDYKKGMYKPAMEKLIQESQKEIDFCGDLMKRRLLNVRLNDLIENLANDSITQQQHDEIIRTGKRLILVNVMRDWLIDETDVESLIESKRPV